MISIGALGGAEAEAERDVLEARVQRIGFDVSVESG